MKASSKPPSNSLARLIKTAAVLAIFNGLGFGLPAAYGTWYFARYGFPWIFIGFPTHETARFFEQFGIFTSTPLIAGFVLVCAAQVACGLLLWANKPVGRWLAFALLPFEFAYWLGFDLPFGPPGGLLRTALVFFAMQR